MRDLFLLDPQVIFLNHGSFGACPAEVFAVYQDYQRQLERQPVEFLGRRFAALMDEAREALAEYLHADAARLLFLPNATFGVNTVARSLAASLMPGDEILTTDHEYGACDFTWQAMCRETGAVYVRHHIPLPFDASEFVESMWAQVTPQTRVLFLSHITSLTAVTFPIAELCQRARDAGIITVIDGAHAPGQLPLDLDTLGADYYTGNCHKWLCAPKGAAFLYVRTPSQLKPFVVSWGMSENALIPSKYALAKRHEWRGTQDIAAYLSVPAAIAFQARHDWDEVRRGCHALAYEAQTRINSLTGLAQVVDESDFVQMALAELPISAPDEVKARLYDEFCVEVPLMTWNGRHFIRVAIQGYNTREDVDALLNALRQILEEPHQL